MKNVQVTFATGKTIETSINGNKKSIEAYYIGKYFDLGAYPKEDMQKAIKVIIKEN